MNKFCSILALAVVLAACSDDDNSAATIYNLDRPTDLAFACHGGLRLVGDDGAQADDPITTTAMPSQACAIYARRVPALETDPPNVPDGQEPIDGGATLGTVSYLALILQSGPGTVALAKFPARPATAFIPGEATVVDTDTAAPGKNSATVGSNPIALATDASGCFALSANAGSCDLSELEINTLLDDTPGASVIRTTVQNSNGDAIMARPAAMAALPMAAEIGVACPAAPRGIFYVAYPSCHAVAVYDAATRRAVASIQFAPDGTASLGDGALTCPADCAAAPQLTPGAEPSSLAVQVDARVGTSRLAIGLGNRAQLTIVDLDAAGLPTAVGQVALEGEVGVRDVALTRQIGMGGSSGFLNDATAAGGQFQFVYAIATDASIRIASVLGTPRECDAQIDPRALTDNPSMTSLACLTIGSLPRRPGADGPGLRSPDGGVPVGVDTVAVEQDDSDTRADGPDRLIGHFAFMSSSTGLSYLINIDDDNYADTVGSSEPLAATWALALPHQFRDQVKSRDLRAVGEDDNGDLLPICETAGPSAGLIPSESAGGARLADEPAQVLNGTVDANKAYALPRLRNVLCEGLDTTKPVSELSYAAPLDVRAQAYPDLAAIEYEEAWDITFEGALSQDSPNAVVDGPAVRNGQVYIDGTGMQMIEPMAPYCGVGVEPFDDVVLRGCDLSLGDLQCGVDEVCYVHPDAVVSTGMCIREEDVGILAGPCRDFFISMRHYAVQTVAPDRLRLVPRRHVLRTTPLDGCVSDAQCDELASYEWALRQSEHPGELEGEVDARSWACEPDPTRAGSELINRCVMTCETTQDCDAGTTCVEGRCDEGVIPPLQCATTLQRYQVHASDAFTIVGERTGYLHPWSYDEDTGSCVRDDAKAGLVGRIPLVVPACGDDLPLAPNPCLTTISHTQYVPTYTGDTCVLDSQELVTADVPAIWVRTPLFQFHLVAPFYEGDAQCRGDGALALGQVPTAYQGYRLEFRQIGGFAPYQLPIDPVVPAAVKTGPEQSMWVLDFGDLVTAQASLRGRVFRVESSNPQQSFSLQ